MTLLQGKVGDIGDDETKRLIDVLARLSHINVEEYAGSMILHFFQQALHPNGAAEKPVPIDLGELDSKDPFFGSVLRQKVGKTGDHLHQICVELAVMNGKGIDSFNGTALHLFLWKTIVPKKPRPKPRKWLG